MESHAPRSIPKRDDYGSTNFAGSAKVSFGGSGDQRLARFEYPFRPLERKEFGALSPYQPVPHSDFYVVSETPYPSALESTHSHAVSHATLPCALLPFNADLALVEIGAHGFCDLGSS